MNTLEAIAGTARPATLYGIGVGPGDVRYLTLRAAGLIVSVDVIAYFAKQGREGNALRTVAPLLGSNRATIKLEYPVTNECATSDPEYRQRIGAFYRVSAGRLAGELSAGRSVGLLAEGDPFFFGSFMHMWRRLEAEFSIEVVPGVTGMSGCWTRANTPISWGDDVLTVLTGTLDEERLARRLRDTDAAVIMKVGRNLDKVRRAVAAADCLGRAIYIERGTMSGERIVPLADCTDRSGPYFSMVLIPGNGRRL